VNVFESIVNINTKILPEVAAQQDFEIAELSSNEIENISGGILHIRKLPQITNNPDTVWNYLFTNKLIRYCINWPLGACMKFSKSDVAPVTSDDNAKNQDLPALMELTTNEIEDVSGGLLHIVSFHKSLIHPIPNKTIQLTSWGLYENYQI